MVGDVSTGSNKVIIFPSPEVFPYVADICEQLQKMSKDVSILTASLLRFLLVESLPNPKWG